MSTVDQKQVDWNSVAVTEALWDFKNRIANGVMVVDKAYGEFQAAEEAYVMAEDRAPVDLEKDGVAAAGRRYHVAIVVEMERNRLHVAERAYKKAQSNMKALVEGLGALRSIGAGVREEMKIAGV